MSSKHFNGKEWKPCRSTRTKCRFQDETDAELEANPNSLKKTVLVKKDEKAWEVAEKEIHASIKDEAEKRGYKMEMDGRSNSHSKDGKFYSDDEFVGAYEVKKYPSAAGTQAVIVRDDNTGRYSLAEKSEKEDEERRDLMLKIANKIVDLGFRGNFRRVLGSKHKGHKEGQVCNLCELDKNISANSMDAFIKGLTKDEVIVLFGVPSDLSKGKDGTINFIACEPTPESIGMYFDIGVDIRPKPSGSSNLSAERREGVLKQLNGKQEIVADDGSKKVLESIPYTVSGGNVTIEAQHIAAAREKIKLISSDDKRIIITKGGQVKGASPKSGINPTIMLSLHPKESITEDDYSTPSEVIDMVDAVMSEKKQVKIEQERAKRVRAEAAERLERVKAIGEKAFMEEAFENEKRDSEAAEKFAQEASLLDSVDDIADLLDELF